VIGEDIGDLCRYHGVKFSKKTYGRGPQDITDGPLHPITRKKDSHESKIVTRFWSNRHFAGQTDNSNLKLNKVEGNNGHGKG